MSADVGQSEFETVQAIKRGDIETVPIEDAMPGPHQATESYESSRCTCIVSSGWCPVHHPSHFLGGGSMQLMQDPYDLAAQRRKEHEMNDFGAVAGPSSPHQEAMDIALGHASDADVEAIRRDERMRLASLLSEGRHTIASFAGSPEQLVDLIGFMLTLDHG